VAIPTYCVLMLCMLAFPQIFFPNLHACHTDGANAEHLVDLI